jgi:hypothetical protein
VRHALVQRVVKAYDRYAEQTSARQLSLRLDSPPDRDFPPPTNVTG